MEMIIDFPEGLRVDAHLGKFTIRTDQPLSSGGEETAPTPFALFLASIGTCAGVYVLSFCRQRNLPTEKVRLIQHIERNRDTGIVSEIKLEIQVPKDFPEKYYDALVRSASQCTVKKHLENPPQFEIFTKVI
ncbi:MAG TPA: OsmC family protein [Candidatus Marinimicrobia bacterium]|nr:OsmC family protein [Candidatus Neomarinimicrobiota bacterium]HRU91518.1 OsmC family protein [Candidatus Neomarinimicrobiota bacterium]